MSTRKKRKTKKQKKRIDVTNKKLLMIVKFIILLNVFAIPLYAILLSGAELYELKSFTTDITYSLLDSTGMQPERDALLISIPVKDGKWGAIIDWDCTAWKSMLAFFALVMATGIAANFTKRKMLFGMIFIPIIYFVNILRIWFMFAFVQAYNLAYFDIAHTIVWSWGLIIIILVFWVLWMKYIKM